LVEQQVKEVDHLDNADGGLIALLNGLEARNVKPIDVEIRVNRYLDMRARQKGIPIRGTFELTPLCNLDCKMCYAHLSEQQLKDSGKTILDGASWIKIMQQAIDAGMIHAVLTGGEALAHPDFDEIYLFLQRQGVTVGVNTNGLLLTDERVAFFKQHKPNAIQVSVYGYDEETYESVTGKRVFARVTDAIQRLRDNGIYTTLGITPNRYLGDGIEHLLRLVSSFDLQFTINAGLFTPRCETGRHKENHDFSLDEYVELSKLQAKMAGMQLKPACDADIPPIGSAGAKESKGLRCGGGRSSFAVSWDGKLQPCVMLSEIQVDLSRCGFSEAWGLVHSAVCEYPSPVECTDCPFRGICPVCVVQHAKSAPLGHANPMFCERARRFALEGIIRTGE